MADIQAWLSQLADKSGAILSALPEISQASWFRQFNSERTAEPLGTLKLQGASNPRAKSTLVC